MVRVGAAKALGEIKDPRAIEPLAAALRDDHPLVREMAVLALGEIENPSAVDALTCAFEKDEMVGDAVAWALGEILLHPAADPAVRRPWDEWLDPRLSWTDRRRALAATPRPQREGWFYRSLLAGRH